MGSEYREATKRFDAAQERFRHGMTELFDDAPELDRLSTLDPLAYDREREPMAERLGVRVSTLDRAVAARRPVTSSELQGQAIVLTDPKPADAPVNGCQLMSLIVDTIRHYLVLPPYAADAIALWVLRAHLHDLFDVNPRLAILSPEKRCGKTTLLEILEHLVPRALMASNVTPSVIYRVIEAERPTLLIDEFDSFKDVHEELRGILNSGHRRAGARVIRTVGDDHEPRSFSTWCPMIVAAIGQLPATLADRSIIIPMQRRARGEKVSRLRWASPQGEALRSSLDMLARGCARWVADHIEQLQIPQADPPSELHDRAADNWTPLLAIAEILENPWPARARKAALCLSGQDATDWEGDGVQLLTDICALFSETDLDRIGSTDLCDRLTALEERPWSEWRRGKPLSPAQLSRLLRPFEVRSRNLKQPDGSVLKGYLREDFEDAFSRYLPSPAEISFSNRYPATSRAQCGDEPLSQSATDSSGSVSENSLNPASKAESSAVANQNPEMEAGEVEEVYL